MDGQTDQQADRRTNGLTDRQTDRDGNAMFCLSGTTRVQMILSYRKICCKYVVYYTLDRQTDNWMDGQTDRQRWQCNVSSTKHDRVQTILSYRKICCKYVVYVYYTLEEQTQTDGHVQTDRQTIWKKKTDRDGKFTMCCYLLYTARTDRCSGYAVTKNWLYLSIFLLIYLAFFHVNPIESN